MTFSLQRNMTSSVMSQLHIISGQKREKEKVSVVCVPKCRGFVVVIVVVYITSTSLNCIFKVFYLRMSIL